MKLILVSSDCEGDYESWGGSELATSITLKIWAYATQTGGMNPSNGNMN